MPITFTPLGMVTDLREVQALNASSPISVTVLGILTDLSDSQKQNNLSGITFTPSGITTSPVHSLPSMSIPFTITNGFSLHLVANQGVA